MELKSHPSEIQQAASLLRSWGWSGFWIQFVLTIVSGLILGFAILSPTLNLNREQRDFVNFKLNTAIANKKIQYDLTK